MNYRHLYHAGSFMDVVKHVVLTGLITALGKKETAFCYLDTHAGIGYYDLLSDKAMKTREFETGIEKVIHASDPPPLVQQYLDCVRQLNSDLAAGSPTGSGDTLRYYPGSPMIARALLRPQDRMVLCELHPEDYKLLQQNFARDKQTAVHHLDGYSGLKAYLPPKERRGMVLIDPPYENPDEWSQIVHGLHQALKRWETGIYAIWYPIKDRVSIKHFLTTLTKSTSSPIITMELSIYPEITNQVSGCGMVIINAPWQFDQTMNRTLPWLWNVLSINAEGAYSITHSNN